MEKIRFNIKEILLLSVITFLEIFFMMIPPMMIIAIVEQAIIMPNKGLQLVTLLIVLVLVSSTRLLPNSMLKSLDHAFMQIRTEMKKESDEKWVIKS